MAILFNINGLFAIDSTGAMELGGAAGASTYVLMSNGAGNANSWYDVQSKFAEYLPLTGGTLTGNLAINGTNTLSVGGATTLSTTVINGNTKLATTNATSFTDINADSAGLYIETAGSTDALSDMRLQTRASGAGNYIQLFIKSSNQSFVFSTNGSTALTIDSSQNSTFEGSITGTTATFSGLVSGITPTAAANFATKAYVDGIGGGVSKIIASTNITISPVTGLGDVTISATDTNTTYTSGNGITFTGTPATVINADINYISYSGTNNFIVYGTQNNEGTTIPTGSQIIYADASGTRIVSRGFVSDLPFTNNTGDLTSITLGNGLTGSSLTGPIPNILMSGSYTGTFTATSLASNSFLNNAGSLLFSAGQTTGTARSLNLRTTNATSDPSSVDVSDSTGITWGQRTDSNPYYIIYPNLENYNSSGNYSKLTLAWHTGIRIGANDAYGGTRFYDDSPDISGAAVILNVGVGNTNVGVVNNLTVGGDILVDNEIWLSRSNNDRNLRMTGLTGTDGGFAGFSSTGANLWQLYGSGNSYGFLNSEWGSWDLEKAKGSNLYMNNNTTYYLNTTSNSNFAGSLNIGSNLLVTGSAYQPASGGGYIGKPYGGDFYRSNQNVYTGAIQVTLPTGGTGLDDMLKFVIDIFDYATQESVTVFVGGYTYQNVGAGNNTWYNVQAQVIGQSSAQNYTVRFGDNGTSHCVWVGDTNSSWNHLQVIVRDFFVGYGANISNWIGAWDIDVVTTQTTVNNTLTNNFPMSSGDVGGPYLPLTGGTLSGALIANGGLKVVGPGSYNSFQSTNDYILGLNDTNGTSQWWLKAYTTGNFALHENTVGDQFTIKAGGNVGIGVTGPVTKLEVAPSISNSSIKTGTLELQSYSVNNAWLADNLYYNGAWYLRSTGYASQVYFGSGGDISFKRFATGNAGTVVTPTLTMQLDSAGNVGIGKSQSGNAALTVRSSAGGNTGIILIEGDTTDDGWGVYATTANKYIITRFTGGSYSDKFTILEGGNVGIGTDSPAAKLHINGNIRWGGGTSAPYVYSAIDATGLYIENVGSTAGNSAIRIQCRNTNSGSYSSIKIDPSSSTITAVVAGTNRMSLGDTSYIYHNTGSTNFNANGYIYTQSWINLGGGAGIYSSTNSAHFYPNNSGLYGTWRIDGSKGGYTGINMVYGVSVVIGMFDASGNGGTYDSTSNWHTYWHRNNSCLAIAGSGTSSTYSLYVHGAIYATSDIVAYSDRRSKENIVTIDNALDKVSKIRGVYYTPKKGDDKSRKVGVIAQELNEILPEAVTYAEDVDQYGVDYGKITGLLIEAVKELQARVKELENK